MNTTDPYISIVTVNYNGAADTAELIASLLLHLDMPFEIIVVDNASVKDEAAILKQEFPQIKAIRSEKNLGFAGGNNLGMACARGKYILLLNNDTYVVDSAISVLCRDLDSNPDIAAASPKIMFADSPQTIQFAGYTPLSRITLRNVMLGNGQLDEGQYNNPLPIPYLHGAALIIRKDVFDKTGGIPECYFLYYEEVDWCEQMTRQGYRLWYLPSAKVYHKESMSVGKESTTKYYYMTRNRLLFAWRNRSNMTAVLSSIYQLCIALPKSVVASIAKGHPNLAIAALKGAYDFFARSLYRNHD